VLGVRRPEWVLGAATLVSLPMLSGVMHGTISTSDALLRFLAALLVCWVLVGVLTSVIDRYADSAAQREFEVQVARKKAARDATAAMSEPDQQADPGSSKEG
jgi:hypothetical protein